MNLTSVSRQRDGGVAEAQVLPLHIRDTVLAKVWSLVKMINQSPGRYLLDLNGTGVYRADLYVQSVIQWLPLSSRPSIPRTMRDEIQDQWTSALVAGSLLGALKTTVPC